MLGYIPLRGDKWSQPWLAAVSGRQSSTECKEACSRVWSSLALELEHFDSILLSLKTVSRYLQRFATRCSGTALPLSNKSRAWSAFLGTASDVGLNFRCRFLIRDSDRLSASGTDNLPQEEDDLAEAAAYAGSEKAQDSAVNEGEGEPPAKKQRLSGAEKKRLARARDADSRDRNKSETRGQNKNRTFKSITDKVEICWRFANGEPCPNGER